MITFVIALVALIAGYFIYGSLVEKWFGIDETAETPAVKFNDGVDFVPMPAWRIFMIQFLNIAGLGPIFGAIMGALYGPAAFLWIVFGCIFAGAVHDFFSGMLSIRHDGASIPEVVGQYLGNGVKQFMRGFSVILLLLVGVVFILGPAGILSTLADNNHWPVFLQNKTLWLIVILLYYIAATMLPVDKVIGKIYPVFGAALLIMAFGLLISLLVQHPPIPNLTLDTLGNMHSKADSQPLFPMLFITIACGAISGFHSTQSPMMARCMKSERLGRRIFYGAMITEGIVALIWAATAMSFWGGVQELNDTIPTLTGNKAATAVNIICSTWLGKVGGVLAILGVIACPITSGDTAFRSARLIVADFTHLCQKSIRKRLLVSVPLFVIALIVTNLDFTIIWRYFGFSNQTLSVIVLWAAAVYMAKQNKNYWIVVIPAAFMTAVCSTYILLAPEGLRLAPKIAYPLGGLTTVILLGLFFFKAVRKTAT